MKASIRQHVYRAVGNLGHWINIKGYSVLPSHCTNAVSYIQTNSVRSPECSSVGWVRNQVHKSRAEGAKILHMPSRSQSPHKKRQPSPSHQETPDMLNAEILHGYPEIGSEPLKLPKTKVRPIYWEKSFLTKSKTQNDYLQEWHQDKSKQYLQRITRHQGYSGTRACSSCNGCGSWKCLDCIGHPIYCIWCCREQHARHVFHRVEHWNSKFFEEVSLY